MYAHCIAVTINLSQVLTLVQYIGLFRLHNNELSDSETAKNT